MTAATKITTLDNGPFLVTGAATIVDATGQTYHHARETIALYCCGASTAKPFCDGTHSKMGFAAMERAVEQASAS
jgi:CDGSH-type Zn-finger protein